MEHHSSFADATDKETSSVPHIKRCRFVASSAQRGQLAADLMTEASTRMVPADEWVLNEISALVGRFGTGRSDFDTPHALNGGGFSVLRRSYRHASPKGLPGPLYVSGILGGVVVPMQARSAFWTRMPADR